MKLQCLKQNGHRVNSTSFKNSEFKESNLHDLVYVKQFSILNITECFKL